MKQIFKKMIMTCLLFVFGFVLIPAESGHVLAAKVPTASFTSYYVGAPNQGFKPGDGNKLTIKTKYKLKKNGFKGTCRVRLRILNSEGKYVYMKLWTIKKSGSKTVKWDGKASENNKAGIKAGTYVEDGFYKAEVTVRYKATGTASWKTAANAKLARTFIIAEHDANAGEEENKKDDDNNNSDKEDQNTGTSTGSGTTAGSGTSTGNGTTAGSGTSTGNGTTADSGASTGNGTTADSGTSSEGGTSSDSDTGNDSAADSDGAEAAVIPIFTGNKYIDYVAELMIQEAGITETTSEDEKVRLIYHYMTTHFNHVHYSKSNKYKVYYKTTTKLKKEITAYGKKMKKWKKAGTITYDSVGSGILWNMKRRIGECNNHALIFQILCKHVGVEAATCKGYYLNRNGTRAGHYWNSAVVDGKTYYYDVDVEIQNYGNGQGDYYWYKKNLKEAKETHEFHSYDYY